MKYDHLVNFYLIILEKNNIISCKIDLEIEVEISLVDAYLGLLNHIE